MKSTLHLKFIFLYIIFGFLSLFTVATLSNELIFQQLIRNTSQTLYREALLISSDYLPSFFVDERNDASIRMQFNAMKNYMSSSLWLVEPDGTMIVSANLQNTLAPEIIGAFDPAEIGANQYVIGNYHGYFSEDVITVMAPVTQGFSTKGYLLIHRPLSSIADQSRQVMVYVYITTTVLFLLSFIILFGFQFFVYRPLRKITEAATQYSSGNLDYEIPVHAHDEMGYLSTSLNFMSTQLKNMGDYQKKIVANISHDFRSPLTSIKGYVQAMSDGTIPPEYQEKYLNIILFETERLTDLTNDLLTLNEFDTGKMVLNKTNFDIQQAIKQVAATFEGICRRKKISIELLFLPEPVYVLADQGRIQQVLHNLIDNSIKFSEIDSSIDIEVRERNEKIFVSVKDYGMGIPRRDLNIVWERFYKSDLSRGKDKKGTGLGLTIVKEAIQAHNENINVISTEGVGTEFVFSLSKGEAAN